MLDVVIDQLDRINLQAQNINVELGQQKTLIERVTDNALRARACLEKKNSNMLDLLEKYRENSKIWKDVLMVLILVVLMGLNVKAM